MKYWFLKLKISQAAVNMSNESPYPVYFLRLTQVVKSYMKNFNKDDEFDLSSFDSLGVIKNYKNNNSEIDLINKKLIRFTILII